MDSYILPSTIYRVPTSRQARLKLNTIIENGFAKPSPPLPSVSPAPSSASTISSYYQQRRASKDFDDLYDVSESETDGDASTLFSADSRRTSATSNASSLKRSSFGRPKKSNKLSLLIPSPRHWPTIEKLKQAEAAATVPPVPPKVPLSPAASSNYSSVPSLDGSLSSEQVTNCSAPPTPVHFYSPDRVKDWNATTDLAEYAEADGVIAIDALDAPKDSGVMLPAGAMDVLRHLSLDSAPASPAEEAKEMQEVVAPAHDEAEPASASSEYTELSIPSPGGFFSSLDSSSRSAWSGETTQEDAAPSSAIAMNFYNGPWTAPESPIDAAPAILKALGAAADFTPEAIADRTSTWLAAQNAYLAALRAATPSDSGKKSVRFADEATAPDAATGPSVAVFYEAFQRIFNATARSDAFTQRHTRFDALQAHRASLPAAHRAALAGILSLSESARPASTRPISMMPGTDASDEEQTPEQLALARVQRERQALEQLSPAAWAVEALRYLFNGRLLNSPAAAALRRASRPRVLDLGGAPQGDWAWHVACEFPHAAVTTAHPAARAVNAAVRGPSNHRLVALEDLCTLPFPDDHFDVISARSLHALVKAADSEDEVDRCLTECRRVLKPGGHLEFLLMDAEMVGAGPRGTAASVELGFALRRRGYSATPTKNFAQRLRGAGFKGLRRAWTFLPAGGEAGQEEEKEGEEDVAPVAGLLGSWMWEQWMTEMETRTGECQGLVGEVGRCAEEGRKCGAGWRCLSGWATKEE